MKYTFKKTERLCSQILIDRLYKEGASFLSYPLRFVYLSINKEQIVGNKILITASKKSFKKAVDRNQIKRRIREAYRLNKHTMSEMQNLVIAINYIGKQIEEYSKIESQLKRGLDIIKTKLNEKIANENS